MAGETGQYFVRRRGRIMGPFDLTQLERMLRRGSVNRRDACSTDRRNWTPLEDHEELFPKEIATGPELDDDRDTNVDGEVSTPGSPGTELVTGDWFYHYQGNEQGPVTEDQIRKLIADGVLTTYDSVWKQGMEDWKPLGGVFEFSQAPTPGGMVPGQPGMMQPGMMQPGGINITVGTSESEPKPRPESEAGTGLIVCGYVFAFLIPLVGLILGIVTCAKGSAAHGVAHILISVLVWWLVFTALMQNAGMRIGFVVESVSSLVG